MGDIELPWPHKVLWPNGSVGNRHHKRKEVAKHQQWAWAAALEAGVATPDGRVSVLMTFCPKPSGPPPDKDNCMAAAKSYLDGIAKAMGVDDRVFDPRVEIGPRGSKVLVRIGESE